MNENKGDYEAIRQDLLSLSQEDFDKVYAHITTRFPPKPSQEPSQKPSILNKKVGRRDFLLTSLVAAGAVAGGIALGQSGVDAAVAQTKTEGHRNLSEDLLSALEIEANRRRKERVRDPEAAARIDPELNYKRINFVLFGYGYSHEPPFTAKVGTPTILSLDLRTKKMDIISLTRDIRAPEIERYSKKQGQPITPTKLDQAYWVGGFDLMRKTIEDATGFSADFQIVLNEFVLKDLVDKVTGPVIVDLPFDLETQPYTVDERGEKFEPGQYFPKGINRLNGRQALAFLKALPKIYDPRTERNARKAIFFDGVIKAIKQNPELMKMRSFISSKYDSKELQTDFDFGEILMRQPMEAARMILHYLSGPFDGAEVFNIRKALYIVDSVGDGGVQWVSANKNTNPITKRDLENKVYVDEAMAVPLNADPYAKDLVTGYWDSLRKHIKKLVLTV